MIAHEMAYAKQGSIQMPEESLADFVSDLKRALDEFDRDRVAELCALLVERLRQNPTLGNPKDAATILSDLRRKRYFAEMRQVVDTFGQVGVDSPKLRRLHAQALLDDGDVSAARVLTESMVAELSAQRAAGDKTVDFELSEARGLTGRAYKQWYVRTGNVDWLRRSLDAYWTSYAENRDIHLWHGINVVALLARGLREGAPFDGYPKPEDVARSLLAAIDAKRTAGNADTWDRATAMEACVALSDTDGALRWAREYVHSEYTDAFALASTVRQLKEVWRLDVGAPPGSLLLPLLEAELLRRSGGEVSLPAGLATSGEVRELERGGQLEKVFGADSYVTMQWYQLGLERCRAVARLETRTGQGMGTGFLVRGRELAPKFGDELLLLTNAHVVCDAPQVNAALRSAQARVRFECLDTTGVAPTGVHEVLAYSPPGEFDFALLRLRNSVSHCAPLPLSSAPPSRDRRVRLYAIGYPMGGGLSMSLNDNLLIDFKDPFVHYRTPTAPGSSGSPIFDDQWNLVALHHAGDVRMRRLRPEGGTYEANEGIWIEAIRKQLSGGSQDAANLAAPSLAPPAAPALPSRSPSPPSVAPRSESASAGVVVSTERTELPATAASELQITVAGHRFTLPFSISWVVPTRGETPSVGGAGLEGLRIPVLFPRLDKRKGYDPEFLNLKGAVVELPAVTEDGAKVVAKLDDGSHVLPYNKFSIVMHKLRRLPLLTASNVDYRDSVRKINGRKPTRKDLTGIPEGVSEKWVTDERIPENQQLPDEFFTKDGGNFDKGHVVRRDDVCWGTTLKDMQMANGDTFHTTNCAPQVSGFNPSARGEDNWGDFENFIQREGKREKVIVFAGPVLSPNDLHFEGVDKRGELSIQIPSKFWKIVVASGEEGPEAFGFVLEQELSHVPLEFSVAPQWKRSMTKISEIEKLLFGLVTLEPLKKWDVRR